jgi:flavin-dependent dehydrogenase
MDGPSRDFDVIVVGGGPAGTAAAIRCCDLGLRVLLLENNPCTPERPSEALHPGIEPLLRLLGVDAQIQAVGFPRHKGFTILSRTGSTFNDFGAGEESALQAYLVNPAVLRAILLDRAVDCGTSVSRRERAIHPVCSDGRVTGVKTQQSVYSAAFVVDAAGPSHWLCRQLRLQLHRTSVPLFARYGWVEAPEPPQKNVRLPAFGINEKGWTWTAPDSHQRHFWVSLSLEFANQSNRARPDDEFDLHKAGRVRTSDVTWRIVRPCAGPGYFAVGDAAWVLDPASSHGVLKALMSGVCAAEGLKESLADPTRSTEQQKRYCKWAEGWFCADSAALISLYSDIEAASAWLPAAREATRYISNTSISRTPSMSFGQM